jgi:hypothetical protein
MARIGYLVSDDQMMFDIHCGLHIVCHHAAAPTRDGHGACIGAVREICCRALPGRCVPTDLGRKQKGVKPIQMAAMHYFRAHQFNPARRP